MRKSTRIAVWTLGIVAVSVMALALLRHSLLGWATVRFIRSSTGLDVTIERMKVRIVRPSVRIMGMTIQNPPGFEAGEAIRFREIYAEYDRRSLWTRRPHFRKIAIDMPNLVVVRNAKGELNWSRIGGDVSRHTRPSGAATNAPPLEPGPGGGGDRPQPPTSPGAAPSGPPYEVDEFVVRIGSIEMRDFSAGQPQPQVRRMELGFDHTVVGVTDFSAAGKEIGGALLVKAAPILLLSALDDLTRKASGDGGDLMKSFEKSAQKLLKKFGTDPGVSSNLTDKGAAELQRALKKLF